MTTQGMNGIQRPPLSFKQKLGVAFGMAFSKITYGYSCKDFFEEMVRSFGFAGVQHWGKMASGTVQALTDRYGAAIAQLLTGIVAMWQGCTYCSKGHVYAANIYHHKETGELLPLDEALIYWLQKKRDEEVIEYLRNAFSGEKHEKIRRLLDRLFELRAFTAEGETEDDPYLRAINGAWDWATECSIMINAIYVPPLAPIGKDKAAVSAYNRAREKWRAEQADYPKPEELRSWQQEA